MNELVHKSMLSAANNSPDSEALRYDKQKLLYKELDHGSANIASFLSTLNFEKEQCIGLFMDKRIEAILAMYGVMRSGAVYVPLDIKNPLSRIQHIVDQCCISTLLTTPDHVNLIASMLSGINSKFNLIILTDKAWTSPVTPDNNFQYITLNPWQSNIYGNTKFKEKQIEPNDLAAILYTSGSSGVPKGVMITHACIMTFVRWVIEYFQISAKDRCASHAPLHFDLSLLDIFAAHSAGATIVLIPEKMTGNPKSITHLIATQKITIWQSVPSVLVLLLKYGDIGIHQYDHLRHVLFAGEIISVNILKEISLHFNKAIFHNIYGATETNDTFIFSIPATDDVYPDPLPIGRPLPYVDFKIISTDRQSVTDTLEGELLVSTPTMMRGYRKGRQDNTPRMNDYHIPNGSKEYYRTGDIVKMLADGNLLYCGRTDDIIKSNGFRVNMLEIENVLQSHKNISDVAVIPLPDSEIGNRIIAIVTVPSSAVISAVDLKIFSALRLPKYAIPHIFEISTNPLPKTSSGKINKQAIIKSRSNHVAKT